MTKILVVDDDLALADILAFTIRRAGFEVLLAHNGRTALELFDAEQPDLIVLDWNLPFIDGLEVGTRIRANSFVPIIMLTVRGEEQDVVTALDLCADDYVTKPFSPRQLIARIKAVLRRVMGERSERLCAGCLTIIPERHEVQLGDAHPISLTRLETRLLGALVQNADGVVLAESLITRVWGPGGGTRAMLKQLVYRLRKKLENDPRDPTLIVTIPNSGYLLNSPEQPLS
jgi:DNA-binding response OmpR family regulator